MYRILISMALHWKRQTSVKLHRRKERYRRWWVSDLSELLLLFSRNLLLLRGLFNYGQIRLWHIWMTLRSISRGLVLRTKLLIVNFHTVIIAVFAAWKLFGAVVWFNDLFTDLKSIFWIFFRQILHLLQNSFIFLRFLWVFSMFLYFLQWW